MHKSPLRWAKARTRLHLTSPQGQALLQSEIEAALTHLDKQHVMNAVNALLVKGRLQVLRGKEGHLAYTEIKQEEADKFKGLGAEERLVYQLVQKAGEAPGEAAGAAGAEGRCDAPGAAGAVGAEGRWAN